MAESTSTARTCARCGTQAKRLIRGECTTCEWANRPAARCDVCGQSKKIIARGMCNACYTTQHRAANGRNRKKYPIICAWCSEPSEAAEPEARYCGLKCAGLAFSAANPSQAKPKLTQSEREAIWRAQRGPLRVAYEARDHEAVIAAILARCTVTDDGCWEWNGKVAKDGYPTVTIAGKYLAVHRISLEAKERAPLGTQQSHHVCANARCVNPDHLQPATHVENIAEMKARHSYIARIAELEQALTDVAPAHPVLHRVAYAS